MSGYILCQVKRAKLPYYIENISTNIYSIEELCFYFYHNLSHDKYLHQKEINFLFDLCIQQYILYHFLFHQYHYFCIPQE